MPLETCNARDMNVNNLKLIIVAVIAVVLIGAITFGNDASAWAVPLLTLLVGYVVGNAQVTDQLDNIAPIVSTKNGD
jgi:hypothetical protein